MEKRVRLMLDVKRSSPLRVEVPDEDGCVFWEGSHACNSPSAANHIGHDCSGWHGEGLGLAGGAEVDDVSPQGKGCEKCNVVRGKDVAKLFTCVSGYALSLIHI